MIHSEKESAIRQGVETAFLNKNIPSNFSYRPQFISNDYRAGKKVISSIENELLECEEFSISVAFITMGGITPLLQTFKELEKRNIKGRILTTDYLSFSEPKAISTLAGLNNITVKMYETADSKEGFHTKGYIFRKDEVYKIIVGSSNMTMTALTCNKEWNTKIVSLDQGEYVNELLDEFEFLWNSENSLKYEDFIEHYSEIYTRNKIIRKQKQIARQSEIPSLEAYKLKPNYMQVNFISGLSKIYDSGEKRALLISATGERFIIMTA